MSGQGFHVHGPHDHALEHAAHGDHQEGGAPAHHGIGGGSATSQIAMVCRCTAFLVVSMGSVFERVIVGAVYVKSLS